MKQQPQRGKATSATTHSQPAKRRSNRRASKELPESFRTEAWEDLQTCANLIPPEADRALEIALDVKRRARKAGDIGLEAAAAAHAGLALRFLAGEEEAEAYYQEAEGMLPHITEQYDLTRVLDGLGMEYVRRDEPMKGLEFLRRSEEILHTIGPRSRLIRNYHSTAIAFFKIGAYEEALEYNLRTLRLQEEFNFSTARLTMITINIGSVYGKLRDYQKAEEFFRRALTLVNEGELDNSVATCMLNLGTIYNQMGRYREAMPYLHEGVRLWLELNDTMLAAEGLAELGVASLHCDELDNALDYFRKAWDICKQGMVQGVTPGFILSGMGQVHQRRNALHEALDHYLRALAIYKEFGLPEEEMDAHKLLAELYPLLGDYEKAYEHQKQSMVIREQLAGAELHRAAAAVELRDARLVAEREREILHLRAEKAEQDAEFKTKELNMMVLQLTQWNEAFRSLREMVMPHVREGRGQTRSLASSVLQNITTVTENNAGWRIFEEQFERVHSEFLTRLHEKCPRLTPSELRICVLIRMNLSTKQIADALFASELTVKKHRANIRRKMGLQGDDNLNGLLISL